MKRDEEYPITKHTLNLYAGDYAKLQALYPTRVGAAKIIREIVRGHIRKIEEDAGQKVDLVDVIEIELDDEHRGDNEHGTL